MSETFLPSSYGHTIELSDIDFELVRRLGASGSSSDIKKLKQIVHLLQDEPYPELLQEAKQTLEKLDPSSVPIALKESRVSSEEQKEALADLLNWATDTKSKEPQLRHTATQMLPPVRGTTAAAAAAAPATAPKSEPSKKKNAAAANSSSAKPNRLGIDTSSLTSFELAMIIRNEKEKGNECFKAKEYIESVDFYTNAIELDQASLTDLTLYTNRALAHCKLKQWDKALADCAFVLQHDIANIKAYWRRATAYAGKAMHDKAIEDLKHALTLPGNSYISELERALQRYELELFEVEPYHPYVQHVLREKGPPTKIHKNKNKTNNAHGHKSNQPEEKEQKEQAFKRMTIQEVQSEEEEEEEEEEAESESKEVEEITIEKKTPAPPSTNTASVPATAATSMKRIQIVETEDDEDEEEEEELEEDEKLSRQSRVERQQAAGAEPSAAATASSPLSTFQQRFELLGPLLQPYVAHLHACAQQDSPAPDALSRLPVGLSADGLHALLEECTALLRSVKEQILTATPTATTTTTPATLLSAVVTSSALQQHLQYDTEQMVRVATLFYYRSVLLCLQENYSASQAEINHALSFVQTPTTTTDVTATKQAFLECKSLVARLVEASQLAPAQALKTRGNAAVATQAFAEAVRLYEQALQALQQVQSAPTPAITLLQLQIQTNRVLCYLKLQQYNAAESESRLVLQKLQAAQPACLSVSASASESGRTEAQEQEVVQWRKEYLPLKIKAHYRFLLSLLQPLQAAYLTASNTSNKQVLSDVERNHLQTQLREIEAQFAALQPYLTAAAKSSADSSNPPASAGLDLTKEKQVVESLQARLKASSTTTTTTSAHNNHSPNPKIQVVSDQASSEVWKDKKSGMIIEVVDSDDEEEENHQAEAETLQQTNSTSSTVTSTSTASTTASTEWPTHAQVMEALSSSSDVVPAPVTTFSQVESVLTRHRRDYLHLIRYFWSWTSQDLLTVFKSTKSCFTFEQFALIFRILVDYQIIPTPMHTHTADVIQNLEKLIALSQSERFTIHAKLLSKKDKANLATFLQQQSSQLPTSLLQQVKTLYHIE